MRYPDRRDVRTTVGNRDAVFSALAALQQTPDAHIEREQMLDYMESMISELTNIAIQSEEKFIAYLLNLAREEARSAKSRVTWQASAA